MIFPFEIKIKKVLLLDPSLNQNEMLILIKRTITQESPYLKKMKIYKNGNMIIFSFFFGVPFVILLATNFQKYISMVPMILSVYIAVSILFWFINLIKMRWLFNLVVKQLNLYKQANSKQLN